MADLTPRIERLVGRLTGGRDSLTPGRADGLPPELRPGDAGFGEAVARLVAVPLDQFEHEGQFLEIRVPGHDETLCQRGATQRHWTGRGSTAVGSGQRGS